MSSSSSSKSSVKEAPSKTKAGIKRGKGNRIKEHETSIRNEDNTSEFKEFAKQTGKILTLPSEEDSTENVVYRMKRSPKHEILKDCSEVPISSKSNCQDERSAALPRQKMSVDLPEPVPTDSSQKKPTTIAEAVEQLTGSDFLRESSPNLITQERPEEEAKDILDTSSISKKRPSMGTQTANFQPRAMARPMVHPGYRGVRPIYPGYSGHRMVSPRAMFPGERVYMAGYVPQRIFSVRSPTPVSIKKQRIEVQTQTSIKTPSVASSPSFHTSDKENKLDLEEEMIQNKHDLTQNSTPNQIHTITDPKIFSETKPTSPVMSPSFSRRGSRKISRRSTLFDAEDFKNAFCLSCPPVGLDFTSSVAVKFPPTDDGQGGREMIGFATLPEQVHRKTVKRGFDFTLLVVGETGLGKSTLVNSLFLTELYKDRKVPPVDGQPKKTVEIEKKTVEIEEKGVKLRLTVVDTPGFGDGVDCNDDWKTVERYVDEQFNKYFQDESGLNRRNIQDNRVHCCLYFVPPYGHGLRQLDVEFMKRLHKKVNIVPVVAKSDTLTKQELVKLKANLLKDIEFHNITIYQFPDCDEDEDEEFQQQDRELKASIPFAVIGSNCVIEVAGKRVRGRQYPWGIVEVENAAHCDFVKLRTMLISTHMQDMKEVTQDIHYENFRAQCISQMHVALKERNKLRRDSISIPDPTKNEDPGKLLEQKDEEIRRMQEMLSQMQQKLQKKDISGAPPKPAKSSNFGKAPIASLDDTIY